MNNQKFPSGKSTDIKTDRLVIFFSVEPKITTVIKREVNELQ